MSSAIPHVKKKLKIKKSKVISLKKQREEEQDKQKSKKVPAVKKQPKYTPSSTPSIKLIDIKLDNVYDEEGKVFRMQLFGMNENGTTYSVIIDDFKPFLFVKIPNRCLRYKKQCIEEVKQYINFKCNYLKIQNGKHTQYIDDIELVKRHKLYGFDNNKEYIFLKITFPSMTEYNSVKRVWTAPAVDDSVYIRKIKQVGTINRIYYEEKTGRKMYTIQRNRTPLGHFQERDIKLNHSKIREGLLVNPNIKTFHFDPIKRRSSWKDTRLQNISGINMELYESALPPFIRFFHIQQLSPSGWITFKRQPTLTRESVKLSKCDFEYETSYKNVIPQPAKEDGIPIKIASYDIEASSSHGDFPLPKKTYKKFLGEMIELYNKNQTDNIVKDSLLDAFSYTNKYKYDISKLYPKKDERPTKEDIDVMVDNFTTLTVEQQVKLSKFDNDDKLIETLILLRKHKKKTIMDVLTSADIEPSDKQTIVDISLTGGDGNIDSNLKRERYMPCLEGDMVTFIGTTFIKCDEPDSYLNHMIVLNTCDDTPEVPNREIETYDTEAEVLLAWTSIINREDPDIIIGYNTFGFDWKFMLDRAEELDIQSDFIKMSKNHPTDKYNRKTHTYELTTDCSIKVSNTTVASGSYEDIYLNIPGRLQIDLLNYFRKETTLPSYKLDYVASHFISDYITKFNYDETTNQTTINSSNLMGLKPGHFVSFEIIAHSSDMYENGKKFKIIGLDPVSKQFTIDHKLNIDEKLKIKWCLNKDDINHHQIFEYTNQGPDKRAIIAKYCFQDCNLCHTLMQKYDILTGVTELASICSVPMSFIINRGQGIKLLSFISKQCREMNTLMPAVEKDNTNEGYEGAIVLDPKTGFYPDDPVACVDYSSLYPSCMISENISHDSKVWSKEYDLDGNLAIDPKTKKPKIWGLRDSSGNFVYDNLSKYKYVNVTYDTFAYMRSNPKAAVKKIKTGHKICRYAQFPDGKKAIMPSVLSELLASRKATRKLAKHKIVTTKNGKEYAGLLTKTDTHHNILQESNDGKETISIENNDVANVDDRFNDFMKNVLDKRQLSKKIVANSLYGQCGAKTSAFYEKDIAASTTATGRKLLIYGKNIIEKCYTNHIADTKHGKIKVNAEYVYGDTDSIFFKFNPETLEGDPIKGQKALEITIELAIEAGELATKYLKLPHDLEYEKTFMPFLLLSKKRYVGMLYEHDPHKCKRKSMGIVLKRRDNAPIVKDCYGGIIDILMKEKNVNKAIEFTRKFLVDMIAEKFPLDKLIVSKSLRQFYKKPNQIAHKVLAERIGKREPGNKPAVGSRIPFVYIQTKGKPKLQGDRIEDPDYIRRKKLKPDFSFYITNQIQKPVMQVFCLVLEQINEFRPQLKGFQREIRTIHRKHKDDVGKAQRTETKKREKHVNKLIFQTFVKQCAANKKNQAIRSFFSGYS